MQAGNAIWTSEKAKRIVWEKGESRVANVICLQIEFGMNRKVTKKASVIRLQDQLQFTTQPLHPLL